MGRVGLQRGKGWWMWMGISLFEGVWVSFHTATDVLVTFQCGLNGLDWSPPHLRGLGQASCPVIAFTSSLADPLPTLQGLIWTHGKPRSLPTSALTLRSQGTCRRWKLNSPMQYGSPQVREVVGLHSVGTREAQQALLLGLHPVRE